MELSSLPRYSGPVDHLRQGFSSLEARSSKQHPVQIIQGAQLKPWIKKLDIVRSTYGSHMAMHLATEREMFSRNHRLPGLEQSQIALETMMGTDESIDFPDYLNGTVIKSILNFFVLVISIKGKKMLIMLIRMLICYHC